MYILGSRLKELRELKGLRQEDVAKVFSYGKSTISQWESGRNEPEYEILVKLAEYFEVTTDYLLGKTNCLNPSFNSNKIPLLGTIHNGLPILAAENISGYFSIPDSMQADFVFRVTGDNMTGAGILDGDYAICRLSDSPQTGQIIVALKDEDLKSEAALKYYFNDDAPKLKAANPAYADLDYTKGYRCAGMMIGLIRKDSPAYPTYKEGIIIGIEGFLLDTTETKKMEEQLHQSQKMDSVGRLAGGIAHDFNNLLSGIFGYIEMAKMKSSADKTVSDYLDKAFTVFSRAKDLTQQLLTFSKGGMPVRKTGDMRTLIRDSAAFALSGSNITCEFSIDENLRLCDFDENQIAQVIDNIIINSKQAMPIGGKIFITAENYFLDLQENPLLKSGDYIKISIADTGIGIQPDHLKRIFDPFFTTKQQGNGLGLATCYSIIKKHDGLIMAESVPGKGSTFNILLPASEKEIAHELYTASMLHSGSGKILVMDDEVFIRDISREMLKLTGYSSIEACDGEEALMLIADAEERGEPFDGVILDLTIPGGMGGKDTIVEIRKLYPDLPVFASSGFSEDPVISNPEDYGFTGSIRKPYRRDELTAMLNKYMPKRSINKM